jgi:hypothetical protein
MSQTQNADFKRRFFINLYNKCGSVVAKVAQPDKFAEVIKLEDGRIFTWINSEQCYREPREIYYPKSVDTFMSS